MGYGKHLRQRGDFPFFFAQPPAWACYPDVAPCLEWLQESGIAWGIASNFDCRLRAVVAGTPLLRNCHFLAISSEIGWRKPAAEFFAALPAITGLPLARLLLVGNDEANDLEGGDAAGLTAVLLVRHSGSTTPPAITSLGQLPQWLKESGTIP